LRGGAAAAAGNWRVKCRQPVRVEKFHLRAETMTTTKTQYRFVCHACGSDDVRCDAWARWDVKTQSWRVEADDVFDNAYCNPCDGETRLEAVEA
jgi:hypothetical protein